MATVLKDEGTLRNQEESLKTENVVLRYAVYGELVAGALLSLYGGFTFLNSGSYAFPVLGGLVLFLGLAHYMKRDENKKNMSYIAAGRSGEEFVSDLLKDELPDDFYLINDVDVTAGSRTAQNDHIVVAPGGIFLVETKAYAGTLTGTAEAEHWTQNKENETNKVTNPITQSAYHREVLEDFLRTQNLPFREEDLHEFVAMVNKECEWHVEGAGETVDYAWSLPEDITRIGENKKYDREILNDFVTSLGLEPPEEEHTEKSERIEESSVSSEKLESNETSNDRRSANNKKSSEVVRTQGTSDDPEKTVHSEESEARWWIYRDGSVSERTYTTEQLEELDLEPDTKVCRNGEETWVSFREVNAPE